MKLTKKRIKEIRVRYLAAYDNLTDIQRLARAALALKAETTRQTEKAALSAARTNP